MCIIQARKDHGPAAVVLPVRMSGGKGIALESSFQHGLKQERLRTLCQVVNTTSLTLEVSILQTPESQQPLPAAPSQGSRQDLRPRKVLASPYLMSDVHHLSCAHQACLLLESIWTIELSA